MPIALALASSLVWGVADFLGGVFTRRAPLTAVTVVSQTAGFVALLVWLAARGFSVGGASFAFGVVGGLCSAVGLSAFYKGLAVGTMSIVSPVAACGAVVPSRSRSCVGSGRRSGRSAVRSSPSSARCSHR